MALTLLPRRIAASGMKLAASNRASRPACRAFLRVNAFKEDEAAQKGAQETEQKAVTHHAKPRSEVQRHKAALPVLRLNDALQLVQREMEDFTRTVGLSPFGSMLSGPLSMLEEEPWAPSLRSMPTSRIVPVDLEETDKEYLLHAEVPGFTKRDIKVTLDPATNTLTIAGEKKYEEGGKEGKKGGPVMRSHMSFMRTFTLPENVDMEKGINAKTEHGILTVMLPKTPAPPKPQVKEIPVE